MTGQNTTGYGIVAFSPNQDFNDVKKVCWDINSTDLGGGKWTNVIIIPASEYVLHPNLNSKPDREGEGPYRLDYTSHGYRTAIMARGTSMFRPMTCNLAIQFGA